MVDLNILYNEYVKARQSAPLWHSSEIEWDPRDFPRPENPQSPRMTARDWLAWAAIGIILLIVLVIGVW